MFFAQIKLTRGEKIRSVPVLLSCWAVGSKLLPKYVARYGQYPVGDIWPWRTILVLFSITHLNIGFENASLTLLLTVPTVFLTPPIFLSKLYVIRYCRVTYIDYNQNTYKVIHKFAWKPKGVNPATIFFPLFVRAQVHVSGRVVVKYDLPFGIATNLKVVRTKWIYFIESYSLSYDHQIIYIPAWL